MDNKGKKSISNNFRKLNIIKITRCSSLLLPVIVLFFQDLGLSMTQIFLLQSIFAAAVVVLEIPTGYLGDILQRKDGLLIWSILWALWWLFLDQATWFRSLAVAEVLLALAFTFFSWSDTALIYDSLLSLWKESIFKKVKWRYLAFGNFSEAGGALLWGLLAVYGYEWITLSQVLIALIWIVIASTLVEPTREKFEVTETGRKHLVWLIRYSLYTHSTISAIIIYSAITWLGTMFWVWLAQPYWASMDIPLYRFGILRSVWNLSVGIFSWYAHQITTLISDKTLLLSFPVVLVITYSIFGTFSLWILLIFMFGFYAVRGVSNVLYFDMLNTRVSSKERATVLSVKSLAFRALFMIFGPIIWVIADQYGIQIAMYGCALITGILALVGIFVLKRSNVIQNHPYTIS